MTAPTVNLKQALTLAKNAAEKSGAEAGLGLTTIGPDGIRAQGLTVGVFVPFPTGLDREVRVDAAAAYRMASKAGTRATLSLGRTLAIEGTHGTFTLRTTGKHSWNLPRFPARWRALPLADARALSVVAELASKTKHDPMSSVRLTNVLSMSRQFTTCAAAYVGAVVAPITAPRALLLKCPHGQLGTRDNRVFIKTPEGIVHWARGLEGEYPANRIYTGIETARSRHAHAAVFNLDMKALLPLAERAATACRVPADAGWLTVEGDNVAIYLRSDLGGYQGSVPVVGERTGPRKRVGIKPVEFLRFLKALKGIDTLSCAISGERSPLHIWTTAAPALEVLMEPVFVTE